MNRGLNMDDLQTTEEAKEDLPLEKCKDVSQRTDKQIRFMKIIIGVLTIAVISCGILIFNINKQLKAQIVSNDGAHIIFVKSIKNNASDISDVDSKTSELEFRIDDIESLLNY